MPSRALALFLPILAVHCTLSSDLDGLANDAGTDAGEEVPIPVERRDGGHEGDAAEAGIIDGGTDGAPPLTLCSSAGLLFCDDFEGRTDPKGSWDQWVPDSGGATLAITNGILAANITSGTKAGSSQLQKKTSTPTSAKIVLEFDIVVAADRTAFGSSAQADHAIPFFFKSDDDSYWGFIELGKTECDFLVADVHHPAYSVCSGNKVHVSYEVTFHATNGRVRIVLDGNSIVTDTSGLALKPPTTFTFGVGIDVIGTHPAVSATFDNITLR